jgi:hypothetical protein
MNLHPPIVVLQPPAKVGELAPGEANKVYLGFLGVMAGIAVVSIWHADKYWKPKR